MRIYILLVCLVLLCLSGITAVSGQSCSEREVSIEHHSMTLEEVHGEFQFDVYIPPCMDERIIGGYPVVYLLHGQDMGIEVWQEMEMDRVIRETLNNTDIPLFYTVVPQEDLNLLSLSLSEFDGAVLNRLISWIDENYNTCTERRCRSIGGLSRGALWAEKIAFEHPDMFGSLGLMSMPGTFADDQSLYYLAEKHKPENILRIRMDTGSEDSYRHESSKAAAQLNFIGYPFEYNIQPGEHDRAYWKERLSDYFVWFLQAPEPAQSSLTITQTAE